MVGCWVGCVDPLSSCLDEAEGWWRLVALVDGMFCLGVLFGEY